MSTAEAPVDDQLLQDVAERVARFWWVLLVIGALWVVIALVILKFNHASVTTVGILIGIMFLLAAAQEAMLAILDHHWRWLWALFSVLLFVGGILAFIHPQNTFAAFADILGFIFLMIGAFWIIQAFAERHVNELWWLSLTAGILMVILAFWVEGEFFLSKAYTLLVFAGIWALMHGITDIIRAFQIRRFASR
jgi:uncharacterized membrane protein HdeD (DUF308 family)